MKKVAIMTDSTCCIPEELLSKYDIRVIPMHIVYKDKTYRDGVDMTVSEVYEIMRKREIMPTTSVPSPGDFLEVYRQLSEKGQSILCITISALLSKTFEAARVAKEEIPNTAIEVIDSRTIAGGLGFIVVEAARVATEGADLAQTIETARSMMPRVNFVAMFDTLFYLARLGRTGKASAWAASLLNVKPLLEVPTSVGEAIPVARPRTRATALRRLLEIMADRAGDSLVHVIVHHAGVPEEGEKLRAQIASQFNCAELYLTEFTPIMGVHTGPGLLGISFYAED